MDLPVFLLTFCIPLVTCKSTDPGDFAGDTTFIIVDDNTSLFLPSSFVSPKETIGACPHLELNPSPKMVTTAPPFEFTRVGRIKET